VIEDDGFVVDPTGGKQRTIKRLLRKKRELKAEIEALQRKLDDKDRTVGILATALRSYECDCPEYIRDNCRKKPCGAMASDVLQKLEL
jgi:hypothetical protein